MNHIVAAIDKVAVDIISHKELLTELDRAIGDGDHGINMARGFEAVRVKLQASLPADIGAAMKLVGMTLISTVGGASGPLYGTAFLRAAGPAAGKVTMDMTLAAQMMSAALGGIKERGKAVSGEKTMLDALEPADAAFTQAMGEGKSALDCLALAEQAAWRGVEFTKTIVATKGRASYLGDRSLGHQDPGATSASIMLTALRAYCHQAEEAL